MPLLAVAPAVAGLRQQLHLFSALLADPLHLQPRRLRAAPLQGCAWERVVPVAHVGVRELLYRTSVVSELWGQRAPAEVPLPLDRRAQGAQVEPLLLVVVSAVAELR